MKLPRLALAALLAGSLSACAAPTTTPQGPRSASALAVENQQSEALLAEARQKNMLLKDPQLNGYINAITARIDAQRGKQASRLKTYILKDPSANAFTSGAGYVFINAGMLATMENEAEFAMVLAHEIAHEDLGHVTAGMQRRQQVGMVGALLSIGGAVAGLPSQLVEGAVGLGAQAYTADFSRDQESAADQLGMKYLGGAGYNGLAGAKSFEVLKRMYGDSTGVAAFFAGHPASGDRLNDMQALARAQGATEGRVAESEYLSKTNQLRKEVLAYYKSKGGAGSANVVNQLRQNLKAAR